MKKFALSIIATAALTASAFADENELNLQEEFKFDQEQQLSTLVKDWLKPESEKTLLKDFTMLIRVNNRYRLTLKGADTSVVGKMISAANKKTDKAIQKVNFAMAAYFAENGISADTRNCFNGAYEVMKK